MGDSNKQLERTLLALADYSTLIRLLEVKAKHSHRETPPDCLVTAGSGPSAHPANEIEHWSIKGSDQLWALSEIRVTPTIIGRAFMYVANAYGESTQMALVTREQKQWPANEK